MININTQLRVIFFAIVFLLGIKIYWLLTLASLEKTPIYLISFLHDTSFLIINYALFLLLSKIKLLKKVAKVIFYTLFTGLFVFFIIYTPLILDILTFPVNIFRSNVNMGSFMFENFVGGKTFGTLFVAVIGVVLSFRYLKIRSNKSMFTGISVVIAILSLLTVQQTVNPVMYSIVNEFQSAINKNETTASINKLTSPVAKRANQDFRFLNKSFRDIPQIDTKYRKVVVMVMETMNNKMYDKALVDFPLEFDGQCEHHAGFNTPNLDSHTALLSMLNSVFLPYQAYVDPQSYEFINGQNNLVQFFNKNGFFTTFLVPNPGDNVKFISNKEDWSEIVFHDDVDTDEFTCLTSTKVDTGCEDMAVFEDTIKILKDNDKAFTFHEMVYGHTAEWFSKTGITTEEYYNTYFNKMVARLKEEDIWEDSLIVIVADHGPRKQSKKIENYNIPLLFCAHDIDGSKNDKFYSELDFKDLLLAKLSDGQVPQPAEREKMFTVGNSGHLVYGMVTKNKDYIFIDNPFLSTETNLPDSEVEKLNKDFQVYINHFEAQKEMVLGGMTDNARKAYLHKGERQKRGREERSKKDKRRLPRPEIIPDNWDSMPRVERREYVRSQNE